MSKNDSRPMKWEVILSVTAIKGLNALDTTVQKRIRKFLHERIEPAEDPRSLAKYLVGSDSLYRFRVGDYRLISFIDDGKVRVLVLDVGHRSTIYKKHI